MAAIDNGTLELTAGLWSLKENQSFRDVTKLCGCQPEKILLRLSLFDETIVI